MKLLKFGDKLLATPDGNVLFDEIPANLSELNNDLTISDFENDADYVSREEVFSQLQELENKVEHITDLGTITQNPNEIENDILNNITDFGIYTFEYGNEQYIMLISKKRKLGSHPGQSVNVINQSIIPATFTTGRNCIFRTKTVNTGEWTTERFDIATTDYVAEKINELIGGAPEALDTLFEIANALQDDDNAISGLITEISKKADKKDIPTKLSQLEQDITVGGGVSEDKVNEIVDAKIADLVNSAPETLDTLGEVAQAIQENDSVVEALNSAIGNKANKDEVMEIVENNSEVTEELEVVEAETFDIALSSSYDMESDNEVPTSKAVMSMINNAITRVLNEEV